MFARRQLDTLCKRHLNASTQYYIKCTYTTESLYTVLSAPHCPVDNTWTYMLHALYVYITASVAMFATHSRRLLEVYAEFRPPRTRVVTVSFRYQRTYPNNIVSITASRTSLRYLAIRPPGLDGDAMPDWRIGVRNWWTLAEHGIVVQLLIQETVRLRKWINSDNYTVAQPEDTGENWKML